MASDGPDRKRGRDGHIVPDLPDVATPRGAGVRFLILLVFLAVVFVAARWTPLGEYVTREELLAFLGRVRESPGSWAIFIALYTAGATLALPGSLLTLTGGAVFGLWPGFALNLIGSTIGATGAFTVARLLGRDYVKGRLRGRVARLDRRLERDGFSALLLLRVIPLVPYNGLNYASGVSHMRARDFVAATAIGSVPGTFVYTYFAGALVAGGILERPGALLHMVAAALLLAALSLLPLAWRRYHPEDDLAADDAAR